MPKPQLYRKLRTSFISDEVKHLINSSKEVLMNLNLHEKANRFVSNAKMMACDMMNNGVLATLKQEAKNIDGAVTLMKIGVEAIAALILIVIWVLIPQIGSAIEDNMPAINETSQWASSPAGYELWAQIEPMLRVCIIVVIVALVLKVIYDLRQSSNA